ncbi:phage tail tape measure protein [Oleidesulfovibrio alaskensis]|uniref:phage tail tape measure protein n=1 Tax=Oleidesulfovibrio alaskensis TaxID=58180 RepID=UPI00040A62F7|nr:phage tail tape measure protein [Oleidesulfovibrio alaskensis]
MSGMDVQIALRLRDNMSTQARRALDEVARGAGKASDAAHTLARATASADRQGFSRLVHGLRTVDSLSRRAENSMKALGRTAAGVARSTAQLGAGLAAGAYVGQRALARPVDFELRMARMANTAYADRDAAGRSAGMAELAKVVDMAARLGGNREQAAEALDAMLASGALETGVAMRLLPVLQRYAQASGAASTELADIVIRGVQQGFFSPDQAPAALDKAIVAGQQGGFELKDMARWLPQMMASAQGMKGMAGYERLLASAQASAITAGSKDQAGNNLVNLLAKMNSQDAQRNFEKFGIDLAGSLAAARDKGALPLDTFIRLLETRIVAGDKRFAALQQRAAGEKGPERTAILNDMADILQAGAVGQIVQDRQALMALVAEMSQKKYIADVQAAMQNASGAGGTSYDVVSETIMFKLQRLMTEVEIAYSAVLESIKTPLASIVDTAVKTAKSFPKLTFVVTGAATAIAMFGATAAAMSGWNMLTGRGGGGALRGGRASGVAGMVRAVGRQGKGAVKSLGRIFGRGGAPLALAATAADIITTEASGDLTRNEKNAAHVGTAGGLAGALAGGKAGAAMGGAIGTFFAPGVGTAIGAGVGGLIGAGFGAWGGQSLGDMLGNLIFSDDSTTTVHTHINIDGRELASAVESVQLRNARRH